MATKNYKKEIAKMQKITEKYVAELQKMQYEAEKNRDYELARQISQNLVYSANQMMNVAAKNLSWTPGK